MGVGKGICISAQSVSITYSTVLVCQAAFSPAKPFWLSTTQISQPSQDTSMWTIATIATLAISFLGSPRRV